MKKISAVLIIIILVCSSIYAQNKEKKYIDIVKKGFYGVENFKWGIGYKQIPGIRYSRTMGLSNILYYNDNTNYGYLPSTLYQKKNKIYGFFNDKFYYLKIIFEKESDVENDINSIKNLYGDGDLQKTNFNLINNFRVRTFESKDVNIIYKISESEISIVFLNKKIMKEKIKYTNKKWRIKNSIGGWKYLKWDMDERVVKGLLSTYDDEYKKWGWEFKPLNKSIFLGISLYDAENKYYLNVRNKKKLKCYKISKGKKIFFYNRELFCVRVNFNELDREKIIEELKKTYKKQYKTNEWDDPLIKTKTTNIFINNNSLYFVDLKKSSELLSILNKQKNKY
ncbi:MAG: hypothetical protein GY714_24685 [Desulfobacterales bacterium]|nr:hypothetical protein [Desulfobacterales bacterium]